MQTHGQTRHYGYYGDIKVMSQNIKISLWYFSHYDLTINHKKNWITEKHHNKPLLVRAKLLEIFYRQLLTVFVQLIRMTPRPCVWSVCARVHEATAEPAAGARGMQYPVESNGTFMETTTSSQSSWFTEWSRLGSPRLARVSLPLVYIYPKDLKK